MASQVVLVIKNPPANAGDIRDIPHANESSGCIRSLCNMSHLTDTWKAEDKDKWMGLYWGQITNPSPVHTTLACVWAPEAISDLFCSVTNSGWTLCNPMDCSMPGFPVHHHLLKHELLKIKSIESVMPSNHLILCRPLLLLPPIPPSIRVFSSESAHHTRWPKYWSFSFSISSSSEYSALISFKIDSFNLLAVQGTLKSLNMNVTHLTKSFHT